MQKPRLESIYYSRCGHAFSKSIILGRGILLLKVVYIELCSKEKQHGAVHEDSSFEIFKTFFFYYYYCKSIVLVFIVCFIVF